ncbi:hypothetical protein KR018_005890, partial [Drosophila ironensis]
MIKLQLPPNYRCGEVLFNGPAGYDVRCSLCAHRLKLEDFPLHFSSVHLVGDGFSGDYKTTIKLEYDPIAHNAGESPRQEPADDPEDVEELALRQRRLRRVAAMKNILVATEEAPLDLDWTEQAPEEQDNEENEAETAVEEAESEDDGAGEGSAPKDMLFQCDQCDRAYSTKRSLQGHRRMKHSSMAAGSEEAKDQGSGAAIPGPSRRRRGPPKVYQCTEKDCLQTFRTERDLRGHRWKHTGIFCDICGKPFTQSGNMIRHRLRHTGIKPHKCPECEATFYTQKELASHSICHTGRMPCICEVCGRPCRDRGVLTAHMRRHTGERPAKCDVCGKAFYSFHDLNVHAVSHTNLRPFVCDVCGSTFQRKKALRVHKLLHSEQRKYACKLCGKAFAQSGGLNAHMRSHDPGRVKGAVKPLPHPVANVELIE